MKLIVKVSTDEYGNVIRQSSNPEYGYIILKQERVPIFDNGFVGDPIEYTALLRGKISNLTKLKFEPGQQLPGNIITIESTKPFNEKDPERNLKIDVTTGEALVTLDNQPIYREFFWDRTGAKDDIYLPNKKVIRENKITTKVIEEDHVVKSTNVLDAVLNKTETEQKEQLDLFSTTTQEEKVDEVVEEVIEEVTEETVEEEPVYIVPGVGEVEDEVEDEIVEETEDVVEEEDEEEYDDIDEYEDDFEFNL